MNMQIELNATERDSKASMNFESRNPATGELLGVYREHDKAETEVRLQRAWDGWRHWSRTPLQERIAFLTRLAGLLEERGEACRRLIAGETGGPEGLYVNLAIGVEACAAVIADPRVRAATVTGSVRAGRAVAEEAAQAGKRVVLELGGSDPFIVLEDADLARAVQLAVTSRYFNNSEGCICAKRFLVAESLFDDFTKTFVEQSNALPMGDPMTEGIKVGPPALARARKNLHRQVLDAVKAGARILTGVRDPPRPG